MSEPLVSVGEKIHVITRRQTQDDLRRHFAGEVVRSVKSAVRAVGYVWVFDDNINEYRRHAELRTRIFDLGDSMHIVNVLPAGTDVAKLAYVKPDDRLVVTDRGACKLDINEFGARY